jgi:hypothetical protein
MNLSGFALRAAAVCAAAVAALSLSAGVSRAAPPPEWRYTLVAFNNTSARDMNVFESSDAAEFDVLKLSAYRPPTGLVRDPSIFRHTDGWYYVTYTTGNGANVGFARSRDRVSWTHLRDWPVPLCCAFLPGTGDGKGPSLPFISGSAGFKDGPSLSPFTTKAWAPEWFVDGDQVNVILSMSTGGGFVPYVMTARDASLQSWTFPQPLGIRADHIDTTVVKSGGTYHAFTKNETTKVIEHATAPSLRGPYTFVTPGEWGSLVEGPALVQLPDGDWRMFLDEYQTGRYLYSDSADGLRTWTRPREFTGIPGGVRHFGVVREPV